MPLTQRSNKKTGKKQKKSPANPQKGIVKEMDGLEILSGDSAASNIDNGQQQQQDLLCMSAEEGQQQQQQQQDLPCTSTEAERQQQLLKFVEGTNEIETELRSLQAQRNKLDERERQIHLQQMSASRGLFNVKQQQSSSNVMASNNDISNFNLNSFLARQTICQDLPSFNGNPSDWPLFYSEFLNTTMLCNLSRQENLVRLRKALSGRAKEAVQALLIFPENVDQIIEILKLRFGNSELLIRQLVENVKNVVPIKEDRVDSLIKFYDILTNLIRTLKSQNEFDHLRNPLLFDEAIKKLAIPQRLAFMQSIQNNLTKEPRIVLFHQWLGNKVNCLASLGLGQGKISQQKDSVLTVVDKIKPKSICIYCKQSNHKIFNCEKFKSLSIDDRWIFTTQNALCISCLGKGHLIRQCKRKMICKIDNCVRPHNRLLHKIVEQNSSVQNNNFESENIDNPNEVDRICNVNDRRNKVLLKIIPVTLIGPNKSVETFALLDDGSTVSLIDSKLSDDLGLDGPSTQLNIKWTNEESIVQNQSKIVSVKIKGRGKQDKTFVLRNLKTISGLSLPSQTVDVESWSKTWPFLKRLQSHSFDNAHPNILIGQDNWHLLVSKKLSYDKWNGPVASKTGLGWVIHGNMPQNTNSKIEYVFHIGVKATEDDTTALHNLVKDQWKLENNLMVDDKPISQDDQRCKKIVQDTLKRVGSKFECGLFWSKDNLQLPESYQLTYNRLLCLESKLDKDDDYKNQYCEKFQSFVEKGYVRKLTDEEAKVHTDKTYYLPHFGVKNPNKPNKLRIVFDAACKSHGYCLNDFLLTGPDLYSELPTVLMNFRKHKIVFVGDIKEMFLQIQVRKEDRHAQRILWRASDRERPPDIYEIQVVFFGAKCSPSIAQHTRNKNALDFQEEFPRACSEIIDKHYMDDYLGGSDTVEEAVQLIADVTEVHKRGGFEICNWITNSTEVLSQISNSNDDNQREITDMMKEERILGLMWNNNKDTFSFNVQFHKCSQNILNIERRPTKREVLKVVMSIFDPLGFLSNYLIASKILLQKIWDSGIGWDDLINDEQLVLWQKWFIALNEVATYTIPRLITSFNIEDCNIQLHIFCDASKYAYAACSYLRFEYQDQVQCNLVAAKSRVAPLKPLSIPRLELQGALLAARLGKNLMSSLDFNIKEIIFWSDSEIVLYWLKSSSKRFKVYVAQRVGEIQESTNIGNWRYVPSKQNIADDATKIKPIDFSNQSLWLKGPNFLYDRPENWPKNDLKQNKKLEELEEEHVLVIIEKFVNIDLPEVERFSKWLRYVRAVAWQLRFIDLQKDKNYKIPDSELTVDELKRAETLIFRKIQLDSYCQELQCLVKEHPIMSTSIIKNLPLVLSTEEKLIRLRGRLDKVADIDMSYNSKNPIVLCRKHPLTRLLIHHYHCMNLHQGTETILSNLRQKFWIPRARSAVKQVMLNCQWCKNRKAKPQEQVIATLPSCRVEVTVRPFIKTGVDYFGPFEVSVNRSHEKRYGVIFTCMATRAVHFEIAHDLTSNAFIHVLRQFGARRGYPEELYSDNGSNFRKADKEIREAIDSWPQDEINKFVTVKECKWHFNPPLAPHMGGAWERLIQSVKKNLQVVLTSRHPKEYVLRTLLCEIENIINSRPLTHIPLESDDEVPLTPNDILIGPKYASYPLGKTSDKDLHFLTMWRATQRLADRFWDKWKRDYRQHILYTNKWLKSNPNICVGDVVLVFDAQTPRNVWPRGIIVKVYPSSDGKVRVVDVKTNSGVFKRPITKLIKLNVLKESIHK